MLEFGRWSGAGLGYKPCRCWRHAEDGDGDESTQTSINHTKSHQNKHGWPSWSDLFVGQLKSCSSSLEVPIPNFQLCTEVRSNVRNAIEDVAAAIASATYYILYHIRILYWRINLVIVSIMWVWLVSEVLLWWPTAQPIRNENGRCLCWQRKGWKPWRTCFSRTREKPWLGRSLWNLRHQEPRVGIPKKSEMDEAQLDHESWSADSWWEVLGCRSCI